MLPRPNWDPHLLSRRRVCPSPWNQRVGCTLACGSGGGDPNSTQDELDVFLQKEARILEEGTMAKIKRCQGPVR